MAYAGGSHVKSTHTASKGATFSGKRLNAGTTVGCCSMQSGLVGIVRAMDGASEAYMDVFTALPARPLCTEQRLSSCSEIEADYD